MSHPFGDLLSQHLHRKHGLSQAKLAEGILQDPANIGKMCKGERLNGPQARVRVRAIIDWLRQQAVLATVDEANQLLMAAGMAPLRANEPGEARLLQQLHTQPVSPTMPPGHWSTVTTTPRTNLPAQTTPLIGRQREVTELLQLCRDPAQRLITILGPGGIGKTHLALAATSELLARPSVSSPDFADGIYFIALAPLESSAGIVTAVAEALQFRFMPGSDPRQQLCAYLHQKRLLLVMDNFEHLLDSTELIVSLLQAAPGLKLLITSRARLRLQGEQFFLIDGLAFPGDVSDMVANLADFAAVQLFVQQACRVQPHFQLTGDHSHAVAQICRLVRGMPLGILLAATWVEMLTPAEIASAIRRNLDFLQNQWRDTPVRQQSLRAVFEHSWCLLTQCEQEMFQHLAVFRNGFTYRAVQAVTGAALSELRALVDKSLLQCRPDGRYEMHELLRQYAAEKLDQTPVVGETARDRHCAYYCALLQQRQTDLQGTGQSTALAELVVEGENVRAAWDWAVARRQVERLTQALWSLCQMYNMRARFKEGEDACRLAAEKLVAATIPASSLSVREIRLLAQILTYQGAFHLDLGHVAQSEQLYRQSLALLESPALADQDTRAEKALVLLELGFFVSTFDRVNASQLYAQSLALYQTLDDRWSLARTQSLFADTLLNLGEYSKAQQLLTQSLTIQQALGDQSGSAASLGLLGRIAGHQGQLVEAECLHRECLAVYRAIQEQSSIAHMLVQLGVTLVWRGKFAEGQALFEERLQFYHDTGTRNALAFVHNALAEAWLHQGQYGHAYNHAHLSLVIAREIDRQQRIGAALLTLGQVALAEERWVDAERLLQESLAILQTIGQRELLGWSLACLGYAAQRLGNTSLAQQRLTAALQIALELGTLFPLLLTLPAIALCLGSQAQGQRAVELSALAARYPFVANSRWFDEIAGQPMALLAATLPAEEVTVARAQGQRHDVWATAAELVTRWQEASGDPSIMDLAAL